MNNGVHRWRGGDLLTVTLTHSPTSKTEDKHTVVAIHKEAFSVFFFFFLTIERPVLVMVCLYRHGGKNGGHIAFINHAEVRKRLHRVSIAPGQFNSTEGYFVLDQSR